MEVRCFHILNVILSDFTHRNPLQSRVTQRQQGLLCDRVQNVSNLPIKQFLSCSELKKVANNAHINLKGTTTSNASTTRSYPENLIFISRNGIFCILEAVEWSTKKTWFEPFNNILARPLHSVKRLLERNVIDLAHRFDESQELLVSLLYIWSAIKGSWLIYILKPFSGFMEAIRPGGICGSETVNALFIVLETDHISWDCSLAIDTLLQLSEPWPKPIEALVHCCQAETLYSLQHY